MAQTMPQDQAPSRAHTVVLLLLDLLGLPFVAIPVLWIVLTGATALLIDTYPGAIDHNGLASPLIVAWVFLLTVAWAWLHLRLRHRIARRLGRAAVVGKPVSRLRDALGSGLSFLWYVASFVLGLVLLLAQGLLWSFLLDVATDLLGWDLGGADTAVLVFVLSVVMVLVPLLRSIIPFAVTSNGHLSPRR